MAASGLRPEQALPAESQVESQVDRLKAERERLGGVNLGAEKEAEEVREKLDLMVTDRDDLIAAMPFATDPTSVATFVVGAGVASIGFHLLLGTAAGGLGQRLSPTTLARVSRVGGAAMLTFGAWTLVG